MTLNFRVIPDEAFGSKAIIRIRDINAIVHNYNLFKAKADATGTLCTAVLKGDVYGLQIKDVAPALYKAGARHFFIEELSEGIELRDLLPVDDIHIYALGGLLHNEERYFEQHKIVPCLNSPEQLERWNSYCSENGKGSAIIHLDTHMNRLGFLDDDVKQLCENFDSLTSHVDIEF